MKKFSLFFVVFVSFSLLFAFAGDVRERSPQYRQAAMEKSPGAFDSAEYSRVMADTYNWLRSEAVAPESFITVRVSEAELAEMNNYQCETCVKSRKILVGLVKPVGAKFSFSSLASVKRTADGGMVWTSVLESPGATALRLHFTNFNLPDNSAVYIYGLNGEAFGPYANRGVDNTGDFWSHTLTGPMAYVQLRHFGPISENELRAISFDIEGAGYLSEKFLIPFYQGRTPEVEELSGTMTHCPDNADCVEDASCYSGTALANAKKAVAAMQWVSGAWIYSCTGGLIADSDPGTQIPYFLTAHHCISRARDAQSLECYFQYATSSCHATCQPIGNFPRTLGAALLDSSTSGDHTLLQLSQNPPSGSVFMGWTTQPVANTNGIQLFRVSHPSGAPQAYSEHVVENTLVECSGLSIGEFIYSQDVVGATEGGSSGSPVMNMNGQIVGQLYGGCGYNINDVCDAVQNRTVDGAFAFYYSSVAPWLGSGGGGATKMHVSAIVLTKKTKGSTTTATATVTIVDETGAPAANATVFGTFSGDVTGSTSAVTNTSGAAVLKVTKTGTVTTFSFCVTNVTHASLTYDSAANVETCDTY